MDGQPGKPDKQPLGFYILFLTEGWERFGFYLVSSLLILYMTKSAGYSDKIAYAAFAAFSALLYVMPAVGGYIADHYLGYRRTLLLGAILLTTGYAMMALPEKTILPALACVIIGTSFFKSMPYTLLNDLYKSDEQREKMDGAFTLYYLSIQIGGIVPVVFGGIAAHYIGWHFTFSIAAIGMSIGVMTFFLGRRCFKENDKKFSGKKVNVRLSLALLAGCLLIGVGLIFLLKHTRVTSDAVWSIAIAMLLYVIWHARKIDKKSKMKLAVAIILTGMGAVFFALYYQQPMSLTLFIDRNVDRQAFGMTIPSSSYWVCNPVWIFIMAPLLNKLYNQLTKKHKAPSIPMKFGIGLILMGIGYFTIVIGTDFANHAAKISSAWIVLSYAFQSTAELLVNALGTAMIAKLVHKSVLSVMMGIWFVSAAIGSVLAGSLAKLSAVPKHASALQSMHTYAHAFRTYAWISVSIGIITCMMVVLIRYVIHRHSQAQSAISTADNLA